MCDETIAQYGDYAQHGGVVVFDTETTGVSNEDEVCQIAAARYENGTLTQSLNEYLKISFPMPPQAEEIHGISDAFLVANGLNPRVGLRKFFNLLRGDVLVVAHNARFDKRMIGVMCEKCGVKNRLEEKFTCDTWPLAKAVLPGLENYRLCTLVNSLGVEGENTHNAFDDVNACAGVFFSLLSRYKSEQAIKGRKE